MIFVKYTPKIVAEPLKRQETPADLGPILYQDYINRSDEIKTPIVSTTNINLISSEIVGQETHATFEIMIEGETEELVYDFLRSLIKREETELYEVTNVTADIYA